jgi:hypothetical protein
MLAPSLALGMPIFCCRALEIRIPITKVRQKNPPMDLKTHDALLHSHSDYLQRLTTEPSTAPTTLEHALSEQAGDPGAGAQVPLQKLAEAQQLLSTEAKSVG